MLSKSRVVILGLGLMGGSLAMALKGRCKAIYAVDSDPQTLSRAAELGLVDIATDSLASVLRIADVLILAAPVGVILQVLREIPKLHSSSLILLDVGSTKAQIVGSMRDLPPNFDPVGGHPMCGKETGGLEHATGKLFRGATFAFTPLERTSQRARSFCRQLARAIGAKDLWIDAETHDRWAAATSHLPYLLANSLAASTPAEAAPLVGPGFRSTTRLAVSSTRMMRDILATNRENMLAALTEFRQYLDEIESLLRIGDFDALERLFSKGAEQQKLLTS
jgi:prephenate dehydrogenase